MTFTRTRASQLLSRKILRAEPIAGGDLSAVKRLFVAGGGTVIAKETPLASAEAEMLAALSDTGAPAPAVLAIDHDLLLLQDMPVGGRLARSWVDVAHVLDHLHGASGSAYGWHRDYAFGRMPISNAESRHWPSFWGDHRLRCHLPFLDQGLAARVSALADRLDELLPAHPPAALLHGDLWGGNILVENDRITALIDPACYYGDREVDFAMLSLFDGPPAVFYDACALSPGWEARQPIYRLWPLLVHLRLFGDSYRQRVMEMLYACGA